VKRTELKRGTSELKRSYMPPRTSPRPGTASRVGASAPRSNTGPRAVAATRKPRRDTGPDRATRAKVYEREGGMCASCGRHLGEQDWKSIQHRVRRQVGGNGLENLILLCGSATSPGCHRKAEDRSEEMHFRGYWLRSDEDPRLVPVMLFSEHGSGITAWLTADGQYSFEAPAGCAA
jgi:5-methylcytosine-specific restriction endonuclease McrA